jgi:single-strand DNA-binding protein
MASLNKVTLIGNVGRDSDIRYTQAGDPIMSFSLATTETWEGKQGKQERTEWHKVDVFGALAKALKTYITKGKKLYVEGKLVYDEWEDKQGNKRTMAKIRVAGFGSNIILLGAPGGTRPAAQAELEEPPASKPAVSGDEDVPF